jgi:hypothetical protein
LTPSWGIPEACGSSPLSPPNGQNHEPLLVLVVTGLAATLSVELSELQAASKHTHAAGKNIRIESSL